MAAEPSFCGIYLQELDMILIVNTGEKCPLILAGGGEMDHPEIHRSSLFLTKLTLRRSQLPRAHTAGVL